MTDRQKIEIRLSEVRQRLSEISRMSGLPEEARREAETLGRECEDLEIRFRAAVRAESAAAAPVSDRGRMDRLLRKVRLGNYLDAAASGGGLEGPEKELQEELGVKEGSNGGIVVPWEVLLWPDDAAAEPSGPGIRRPALERVFEKSLSSFLGVSMMSVPDGLANVSVPTTVRKETAVGKEEFRIEQITNNIIMSPNPVKMTLSIMKPDENALNWEMFYRRNLHFNIVEMVDLLVFNGVEPPGFSSALNPYVKDLSVYSSSKYENSNPSKIIYRDFLKTLLFLDGSCFRSLSDLALVMDVETYLAFSVAYRDARVIGGGGTGAGISLGETPAVAMAAGILGSPFRVSDKCSSSYLHQRGRIETSAVACFWGGGIEITRDPDAESVPSENRVAVSILMDFAVLIPEAYRRIEFVFESQG